MTPDEPELHPYAARVLAELRARTPWEREFLQAVEEVLSSISPLLLSAPRYQAARILERLIEPDRIHAFRVTWTDDHQNIQVNRGWRVQFNGALGPYKGGTRFHSSVGLDSLVERPIGRRIDDPQPVAEHADRECAEALLEKPVPLWELAQIVMGTPPPTERSRPAGARTRPGRARRRGRRGRWRGRG